MKLTRRQLRSVIVKEIKVSGITPKGKAEEYMNYSIDKIVGGYGSDRVENKYGGLSGIAGEVDAFRSNMVDPYGSFLKEIFQQESIKDVKKFSDDLSDLMKSVMRHYNQKFIKDVPE